MSRRGRGNGDEYATGSICAAGAGSRLSVLNSFDDVRRAARTRTSRIGDMGSTVPVHVIRLAAVEANLVVVGGTKRL